MITEKEVEASAAYIRDKSPEYAKAKAERIYLAEFRKSKLAILYNTQKEGTDKAKDSYAHAHKEYLVVLEGLREAVEVEETIIWRIKAAQAKIEIWRTQQANNRRIDGSHQ